MLVGITQTRRGLLRAAAPLALSAPLIWTRRATAAQQLVVRTPGGAFDEVKKKMVYDPFREATGIEIVPVASTAAKLLAMYKAGQIDIDVIDTGDDVLLQLEQAGALEPIPYKDFTYTNPDDIDTSVRLKYQVGSFVYAFVLGFNTTAYPVGKEPKSWAEFWDIKAFPGTRTLADMASGAPNLEIALIADGVPMDKVYPIDIERAFRSLSRIKPAVPKFWDTGALSAQMLADKEAVMGVIWNTRVQVAADGGAPLAAQWNQNSGPCTGLWADKRDAECRGRGKIHRLQPEPRSAGTLAARLQGDPGQPEGVPADLAAIAGPRNQTALDEVEGVPD